ncbi:adhesion G protein-coupled receptor E2-like, partial [Limulus polyphemus]|uniref:Adhesion G protein-coupled receptor E2-like n=1 Tax=Limulus polyphemus TaxID=6850 RepID=A0ABM1SDP9_LIMPO
FLKKRKINTLKKRSDINECLEPNSCGKGAQCQNNPGSYDCRCPQGFSGDPYQSCQDVDECVHNPCGSGAICTNLIGGYQCSCPPGYSGDPTPSAGCVDVDECLDPDFHCGQLAGCINTPGSYYCQCSPGYTGDPRVHCLDINECPYSCGVNTDCINNPGSYECQCKPGYIGDPYASIGCKGNFVT